MVVHKKVLILRKALSDRSASHDATGSTIMRIRIFLMLGKSIGLACLSDSSGVSGSGSLSSKWERQR